MSSLPAVTTAKELRKSSNTSWIVHNEHIVGGYRPLMSYRQAAWSLFSLHNETVNVWIHLVASMLFMWNLASLSLEMGAPAHHALVHHRNGTDWAVQHLGLSMSAGAHSSSLAPVLWGVQPPPPCIAAQPPRQQQSTGEWLQQAAQQVVQAEATVLRAMAALSLPQGVDAEASGVADMLQGVQGHLASFTAALQAAAERGEQALPLAQVKALRQHAQGSLQALQAEVSATATSAHHTTLAAATAAAAAATDTWNGVVERAGLPHLALDMEAQLRRHPHGMAMLIISACAAFTMGTSAVYHLLFVVGQPTSASLQKLDYAGISVLICGSTFSALYFFFYCRPGWFWLYAIGSAASCGYVAVMAQLDIFATPAYDITRAISFTLAASFGVLPVLHCMWLPEMAATPAFWTMHHLLALHGAIYLVGVVCYATKWPEAFAPGKYDLLLASHQLFHLCVAVAAAVLYYGATFMNAHLEAHPRFCQAVV